MAGSLLGICRLPLAASISLLLFNEMKIKGIELDRVLYNHCSQFMLTLVSLRRLWTSTRRCKLLDLTRYCYL
ncbi:unnamed protein product [Linum tenue]|uniref:Secreted protein n=1 Tax=Linum tenue TaxID=586396 RepID=A0AAV0HTR7_9ROSI|nr:unnamed protein product [Linum tenue]